MALFWRRHCRGGDWLGIGCQPGNSVRRLLLFSFGVILWLRLLLTVFWLLKRKFGWDELVGVIFACLICQLGFALLGATEEAPVEICDVVGVGIFLLGSYLNTWCEIQRRRFKADLANNGKLYTEGLFAYATHINYFGDTLWVTGWAMLTRNPWAALVPVTLAAGFIFFFIPELTDHLQHKYGEQYDEWAKKTKRYIPFIW